MAPHVHATNGRRLSDLEAPGSRAQRLRCIILAHVILLWVCRRQDLKFAVVRLYQDYPPFVGIVAAIDWDSQRGSHGCTPGCQRGQAPSCGVSGVQQAIQRAGGTWAAPLASRLGHMCIPSRAQCEAAAP